MTAPQLSPIRICCCSLLPMAALLVVLGGCRVVDPTQVNVIITATEGALRGVDELRVQVFDHAGELVDTQRFDAAALSLPLAIPLIPKFDDGSRTFSVVAEVFYTSTVSCTQRLQSTFVEGAYAEVEMLFEDLCCPDRPACGDGQACERGECVSAFQQPRVTPRPN